MSTPSSDPVFRIVHTSDFSAASEIAFVHALKLALAAHAELDVLHVRSEAGTPDWSEFPAVRDTLRRWGIDGNREPAGAPPRGPVVRAGKIVAVDGDPAHAAIEFMQEHPTELVVLATEQRRGLARWLHKATAEPIARGSGAMALFLPGRGEGFVSRDSGRVTLERILLPVDAAPAPQAGADAVEALLTGLGYVGATGKILHVGAAGSRPEVRLPIPAACNWESITRAGSPVDEIVTAADGWAANLIVMVTAGKNGVLDALRGTTTERVVRRARCPVLAVPAGSRAMGRLFSSGSGTVSRGH
jgi:nucleotide-binding universal stress UspA family protein